MMGELLVMNETGISLVADNARYGNNPVEMQRLTRIP